MKIKDLPLVRGGGKKYPRHQGPKSFSDRAKEYKGKGSKKRTKICKKKLVEGGKVINCYANEPHVKMVGELGGDRKEMQNHRGVKQIGWGGSEKHIIWSFPGILRGKSQNSPLHKRYGNNSRLKKET